jgi:integrase
VEAKELTAAAVEKYQPNGKRRLIRDTKAQSLYLLIEPSGVKSWMMRFRRPDGRPAKLVLGRYDSAGREQRDDPEIGMPLTLAAARQLATKVHLRRARGEDVVADHKARRHRQRDEAEQRAATSFGPCLREFFADHKVKKWKTRPRRWRETARTLGMDYPADSDPATTEPTVIEGGLADIWADRPVAEIDDHLIFETLRDAAKAGIPGLARRNRGNSDARKRNLHAALSVYFGWLKRERRVARNPVADLDRPGPPAARDHVLKGDELRWFWQGADSIGAPFGPIFQLLLLTGCRLREVAGMRRDELHDNAAVWELPGSRTKNHLPHYVPLPPGCRRLIPVAKPGKPGGLVFTGATGTTAPSGWSTAKRRVDRAMLEIARKECGNNTSIPGWRLHDLRRSCATGIAEIGIAPHIIEAVLNHVSGAKASVAGIYNRATYAAEKKAALERWAIHIEGLLSGQSNNVVPLQRETAT